MADEWFYTQNNQSQGPVSADVLRSMIASGTLSAQDLVWRNGMPNWSPAGIVPELGIAAAPQTSSPYAPPGASFYPQPGRGGYAPPGAMPVNYYSPNPYTMVAYAGFWLRFVALIIDSVILSVLGAVVGFIIGLVMGMAMANNGMVPTQRIAVIQLVAQLVGMLLNFLYYTLMESSSGQATLGKRALNLQVTNLQGGRISYGQAVGRYFGKILSGLIIGIGFMMAGFTERKQGLHDMLAGTLVIRQR
jgi:uncharacterized RDD family membrane protein YckC